MALLLSPLFPTHLRLSVLVLFLLLFFLQFLSLLLLFCFYRVLYRLISSSLYLGLSLFFSLARPPSPPPEHPPPSPLIYAAIPPCPALPLPVPPFLSSSLSARPCLRCSLSLKVPLERVRRVPSCLVCVSLVLRPAPQSLVFLSCLASPFLCVCFICSLVKLPLGHFTPPSSLSACTSVCLSVSLYMEQT